MALPLAAANIETITTGYSLERLEGMCQLKRRCRIVRPFWGVSRPSAHAYNKAEEQKHTISVTFDGLREEKIFCPHHSSKIRYRSSEARLANFRCLI